MNQVQTVKEPTLIKGNFLNGNIDSINNSPLTFYPSIREKHGDYIKYKLLPNMFIYGLYHPDAVQHVLQSSNYRKPDFFYNSVKPLAGDGLFTSEGDFWLKQRRMAQPAFHKKKIDGLGDLMIQTIYEEVNQWNKYAEDQEINISANITKLTLKVLSKALFSIDISDGSEDVSIALRKAFEYVNGRMTNPLALPTWFPTQTNKNFFKDKEIITSVVDKIIESRRNSKEQHNDLLDMLIKSKDDETGDMLNNNQLSDEMLTMLIAGIDTTSAALSWTFYLLGKNKDKKDNLVSEIDSVIDSRKAELSDLEKLDYTRMVFEESMRLYPPAWGLPREAIEDDVINGYLIKKKRIIALSQHVTHRHPEFWEKPSEFYPEHFEKSKVDKRHKFAYFPFGGGSRMCIGKGFAMMEGRLILTAILQNFDFKLVENHEVIPDTTFTLIPRDGIKIYLKKRK